MKSILMSILALFVISAAGQTDSYRTPSVPGTELYFIAPMDGATIEGAVTVKFGLRGMGVAPAGTEKAGTGHHHLIVDAPLPPFDENIVMDENHIHFGGGQTETVLTLSPGTHTLQLLLADQNHIPHDPPVFSRRITITVKE